MEHKQLFFQKLTPVNDADISVYEEAIDFIFENEDITNVAISGAYSAGKSSVIESYKKKHKNLKFLHISLAHFESQDENKKEDKVKESVLEGKILNQLIHQIPVEKIPQTNFRVKKDTGKKDIYLMSLVLCLLFGSIVFLTLSNKIPRLVEGLPDNTFKNVLSCLTGGYAVIGVALIFIISSVICIYNVVKIQKNKNLFHKVSVQGNTIEIFEKQDESYFDKYLNEVLYLFEQVDADVIVFEDMDRFNVNSIFERLREVNNLTNIQRKNGTGNKKKNANDKYRPLRFFYLLRDDIFVTKDRTKFFDYIVPIVPVLDGSNSYEQFIRHLKKGNIFEKFDTSFLQRLSLYINDMRVLKNVYNEFIIYMSRLDNTDLNWDKMLAIIVYKNLFPRDFSELQLGKGYVHELFEQKEKFSKGVIKQLEEKKQQVKDKIERIKEETLNDIQELDDAYLAKYDRLPRNYYGLTQEREKRKKELENEKKLRKKAIEDREAGILPDYEKEVSQIEHKITLAKTQLLSELVTRNNADSVFMINSVNPVGETEEYNEIKGSDYFELLKFLVRYGYIDETYNDYMTYFYEESLSANDKTFLRKITDKKGADYEYSLKDVSKVISSPILRVVDFGEEETLNFDLLNGLLANQEIPKYQKYLSTLIEQIKNKKQIDFISKYLDSEKVVNIFIVKLNEQWPEIFSCVVKNKALSSEQIRKYSLDTLCLSDEQLIKQINFDNSFGDYISGQDDYLDIQSADVEKIISHFNILEVSFKSINYEKANRDLFDRVYEDSLYDLTFENIRLMIRTQYGITNSYDVKHKNYTLICSEPDSPLAIYVGENLHIYLEKVLENCGGKVEDDEVIALEIINNASIEDGIKEQYINCLITVISDISKVEDIKLWGLLITNRIVKPSVSNVVYYFQTYALDSILVKFINEIELSADYTCVEERFGKEIAEKFFDSVVVNNDVKTEKYEKILNDLGYLFDRYASKKIADDKIYVLIKNRIIEMNEKGLEYIRNNYKNYVMYFIEHNLESYLELLTDDMFVYDEAIQVLDLNLEDDKKIELLRLTNKPIAVLNKNYSDKLIAYILANNFDECDAEYLYQNYSKYREVVRDAIYQAAEAQINRILHGNYVDIDDMLLSDILIRSRCDIDAKIQIWANMIPKMNEETCKKHFDELGVPELKGIFTKKNTKDRNYEKNDEVTAILEALKKNTWIYDYYESENDSERYVVIKNRPKDK